MNNKILSVILVAGIATTGFAGISAANTGDTLREGNSQIRELIQKEKSGETLTAEEQATLETAKQNRSEGGHKGFGKRKGLKNLTDEERTALESMSDEEKKAFFDAKKEEMKAKKEAQKAVIDKIVAGQSLTSEEEAIRQEIAQKIADNDGKRSKPGSEVIAKVVNGETLTAEDREQLAEMKAKHEEREAQRAIIAPIMEKKKAGEDLTAEEQAILDEAKANRDQGKGKRGR